MTSSRISVYKLNDDDKKDSDKLFYLEKKMDYIYQIKSGLKTIQYKKAVYLN